MFLPHPPTVLTTVPRAVLLMLAVYPIPEMIPLAPLVLLMILVLKTRQVPHPMSLPLLPPPTPTSPAEVAVLLVNVTAIGVTILLKSSVVARFVAIVRWVTPPSTSTPPLLVPRPKLTRLKITRSRSSTRPATLCFVSRGVTGHLARSLFFCPIRSVIMTSVVLVIVVVVVVHTVTLLAEGTKFLAATSGGALAGAPTSDVLRSFADLLVSLVCRGDLVATASPGPVVVIRLMLRFLVPIAMECVFLKVAQFPGVPSLWILSPFELMFEMAMWLLLFAAMAVPFLVLYALLVVSA